MDENRILFVDLDGTLIKEDLSNLAFLHCLKKKTSEVIFLFSYFFNQRKVLPKRKNIKRFHCTNK